MQDLDCVLALGDSYTAPDATKQPIWCEHFANTMDLPCVNLAKIGNNNDAIVRDTFEAVSSCLAQGQRPMAVVALSFVRRTEIWCQEMAQDLGYEPDTLPVFTLEKVLDLPEYHERFRHLVMEDFYVHKQLLDLYIMLFGLTEFLHRHSVPFLILSGADNSDCPTHCFPAIHKLHTVTAVSQHANVLPLHDFSIATWARLHDQQHESTGHLSRQGHADFARALTTMIDSRKDNSDV